MPYTPNAVVTHQFSFEDFTFTYLLDTAIVAADVGKAVMLDASASNKVKLATDNALMIAIAGFMKSFREEPTICPEIRAEGNMKLG